MLTKELDTKAAGRYAVAAMLDAQRTSSNNATHYTQQQRTRAERMLYALELCYGAKAFYITYRKKFIVVKVDGGFVKDKKTLRLLEADYAEEGIEKVVTEQAVAYRIKKN